MAETDRSTQLDYAPRPANANRSRFFQVSIVFAIVLATYLERAWPLGIWQHFRVFYLQKQCIKHPIAGGTVVYASGSPIISIRSPQEAALTAEYSIPPYWTPPPSASTVFMGNLVAINGVRRLITIEAAVSWLPGHGADARIFWTAGDSGMTKPLRGDRGFMDRDTTIVSPGDVAPAPSAPEVEIRSAIVDPKDPSHITFTVRVFSYTCHYDGKLLPDGSLLLNNPW
jgi:hypothetical protein